MKKRWLSVVSTVLVSSFLLTLCPNMSREMGIYPTLVYSKTKSQKENQIQFEKEVYAVKQGEKIALKLKNTKLKLAYISENPKVATVDKNTGILSAKNVGTTIITAKIANKKVCKCEVKVVFRKANMANKFVKQKEGKVLELSTNCKITLPENWDYELQHDDTKYIQYICLSLPDDEYKGSIYIKKDKKRHKKTTVEVYTQNRLKTVIGKLQKSNLEVEKASFQMKTFKKQPIGIGTFQVKKDTNIEYRTIMIQKIDDCFIEYDCIATSENENIQFVKAMFHMITSLQGK